VRVSVLLSCLALTCFSASPSAAQAIKTLGSGFSYPQGLAVDSDGNVYVADTDNTAVKKIAAAGSAVTRLGRGFRYPVGVAVDGGGNVYVADTDNSVIKRIGASDGTITILGGGVNRPFGVAVDGDGNVYVVDSEKKRDQEDRGGGRPRHHPRQWV
jgi:sugar lactone lactonase YvrE